MQFLLLLLLRRAAVPRHDRNRQKSCDQIRHHTLTHSHAETHTPTTTCGFWRRSSRVHVWKGLLSLCEKMAWRRNLGSDWASHPLLVFRFLSLQPHLTPPQLASSSPFLPSTPSADFKSFCYFLLIAHPVFPRSPFSCLSFPTPKNCNHHRPRTRISCASFVTNNKKPTKGQGVIKYYCVKCKIFLFLISCSAESETRLWASLPRSSLPVP